MGWPIKKKYDPLRIIAPIISQEAGNGRLFEKLMVMVQDFRILADLFADKMLCEEEIADLEDLVARVTYAESRLYGSKSASAVLMECVEIYKILGVEDPVSETCKELIKLIEEPVRSLGLLGLYCT
jgi:hypothetical protein